MCTDDGHDDAVVVHLAWPGKIRLRDLDSGDRQIEFLSLCMGEPIDPDAYEGVTSTVMCPDCRAIALGERREFEPPENVAAALVCAAAG